MRPLRMLDKMQLTVLRRFDYFFLLTNQSLPGVDLQHRVTHSAHCEKCSVQVGKVFSGRDAYVEQRQHKKKREKRNSDWDVTYDLNFRCGSLNLHRQVGECVGGAAPPRVFHLCVCGVQDVFRGTTPRRLRTFPTLSADGNKSTRSLRTSAPSNQSHTGPHARPYFMHDR